MTREGYEAIRQGDQNQLARFMRRISERLDALEGLSGPTRRFDNLDLDGNKIVFGPENQLKADGTDFITKNYLKSSEAGEIIKTQITSGKVSSLNALLTPGKPSFGFSVGRVDLFARRGSASSHQGEWFFASDRDYVSWVSDGTSWLYVSGTQLGTLVPDERPVDLTTNDVGYLFHTTDTDQIYVWSGSSWGYLIPDASATKRGLVSTGAQTISGNKTFSGAVISDSPTFVVDESGHKVGVGTAAPGAKLHVISTTEQIRAGYDTSNYWQLTVGTSGSLAMQGNGTSGSLTVTPTAGQNLNVALSTTGDLAVNTNQLYVDTSLANVGINTSSPLSELCINGGLHVGGDSDAGNDNVLVDGSVTITSMSTSGFVKNSTSGLLSGGNTVGVSDLGISSTKGDIYCATSGNTIGSLPDVAVGQVLVSGGVGQLPAYSNSPSLLTVTLSSHVTTPYIDTDSGDITIAPATGSNIVLLPVTTGLVKLGASSHYASFAPDGELNLIGTARVTKEIRIDSFVVKKGVSAPGSAERQVGTSGTQLMPVITFDTATQNDCYFTAHLPSDLDATAPAYFHLMWQPGASWTSGYYIWKLEYKVINEAGTDLRSGGSTTISSGNITPANFYTNIETKFSDAIAVAADQVIVCHFYRDAATDTANDIGCVTFFEFEYTANKLGEAT